MKLADSPAFPIKGYCVDASGALCGEVITHPGITLRQYYSGLVLQGLLASPFEIQKAYLRTGHDNGLSETTAFAKIAIELADALIAELEK